MASSEIIYCPDCDPHPYQDPKYGFKMRLCNPTGKMEKSGGYRCTVCGKIHSKASSVKSTTTKKKK